VLLGIPNLELLKLKKEPQRNDAIFSLFPSFRRGSNLYFCWSIRTFITVQPSKSHAVVENARHGTCVNGLRTSDFFRSNNAGATLLRLCLLNTGGTATALCLWMLGGPACQVVWGGPSAMAALTRFMRRSLPVLVAAGSWSVFFQFPGLTPA